MTTAPDFNGLRFPQGLYGITPDTDDTDALLAAIAAAARGGMRSLQWRRKTATDPHALRQQGLALAQACRNLGLVFIVNDDWRLALELDADGVHLGRDDDALAEARQALGLHRIIGVSCYADLDRARSLLAQGADYIAFGAVYPSPTKPAAARAPLALLTQARQLLDTLPAPRPALVAIGGIHAGNAAPVANAGADALAIIQGVFNTSDPEAAARACSQAHLSRNATMTDSSRNDTLFQRACRSIPGGVNSPVRAFRSVGGTPRFIQRAQGPYIWDADGKRYIDYVGSWGPAILGHAHPEVVEAVRAAALNGLSFGAPTEAEIDIAEALIARLPSMEQVRLVSSGTEATMSAIRLARGATGRSKIIKFEGCYHGHADSLLVKAGSGMLTFNNPTSAGVPQEFVQHTLVLDYNDSAAVEAAFTAHGDDIACIIVEPFAGNMNLVRPAPGFLETLRTLCTRHGALLIFDEVMTGFRVGPQGAQGLTGVTPDLTTLAKIIGGGMPVGAFGGRADVMANIAPLGAVYQAGTLSGNPVAVAAGLATLRLIGAPGFYETLSAQAERLCTGLNAAASRHGIEFSSDSVGGMFGLYFRSSPPTSFAEVQECNVEHFKHFFHAMLDQGVHLAPSAFEAGFVSGTHDDAVIDATLAAADKAFAAL